MERGRDRAERVGEKVERKRGDRDGAGRKGRGRRRGVSLVFFPLSYSRHLFPSLLSFPFSFGVSLVWDPGSVPVPVPIDWMMGWDGIRAGIYGG